MLGAGGRLFGGHLPGPGYAAGTQDDLTNRVSHCAAV
jgi:hypothetical protein